MRDKGPIESDEDKELISRSQKGDLDAFELLVKRHQRKIFNIAFRMMGDREEAANLVQEAFLSAHRGLIRFKGESRFSTWLYAILMNLSRNRLHQLRVLRSTESFSMDDPLPCQGGEIKVDIPSGDPTGLEILERKEIQEKVQECISTLDGLFREVLVLRDIQGFAYEEICDMLHLPEGTVKSRLFRARESLKECLKRFRGDL